jgi:hypothetical protein
MSCVKTLFVWEGRVTDAGVAHFEPRSWKLGTDFIAAFATWKRVPPSRPLTLASSRMKWVARSVGKKFPYT